MSTGMEKLLLQKIVKEGSTENDVRAKKLGCVFQAEDRASSKGRQAANCFVSLRNMDKEVSRRWGRGGKMVGKTVEKAAGAGWSQRKFITKR